MSDPPEGEWPSEPGRSTRGATRGKALRILRVLRGLTQAELARRTGLNKATISCYELGRRTARFESVVLLLGAMELPLAALDAAGRLIERLDSSRVAPDVEEMASQAGHYAESLMRWLASLLAAREAKP